MDLDKARSILIDHARSPRNHTNDPSRLASYRRGESRNPLCGDLVKVFVKVEDAKIVDCVLQVQGCTVCTASASLMSIEIKNLAESDAHDLRQALSDILVTTHPLEWPARLKAFEAFSHLRVNPARIPCALIPWFALKDALNNP